MASIKQPIDMYFYLNDRFSTLATITSVIQLQLSLLFEK